MTTDDDGVIRTLAYLDPAVDYHEGTPVTTICVVTADIQVDVKLDPDNDVAMLTITDIGDPGPTPPTATAVLGPVERRVIAAALNAAVLLDPAEARLLADPDLVARLRGQADSGERHPRPPA